MKIKKINADGTEVEVEAHKVFETEAEFNSAIKSANSQGKNEILQALGVSGVEEAKTKMGAQTKVDELTGTVKSLETKLEKETLTRYGHELKIKPELVDKVIILAKAQAKDGDDLRALMEQEAKTLGAIVVEKAKETDPKKAIIGNPKSQEQLDLEKAEAEEMARFRNM